MPVVVLLNGSAGATAVTTRRPLLPIMGVGMLPLMVMLVLGCL